MSKGTQFWSLVAGAVMLVSSAFFMGIATTSVAQEPGSFVLDKSEDPALALETAIQSLDEIHQINSGNFKPWEIPTN